MPADPAVHPTALVHPGARLGEGVTVGPCAVVEDRVIVGRATAIGAYAVLKPLTEMGEENRIFAYAVIGDVPQHLGFSGEETRLVIGNRNTFREFVTIHRGTQQGGGETRIGDDNLFMAYSHVAHDCVIGSRVVVANAVQMGGHVRIEDDAYIGGLTAIHQYVRIGSHSMVGGASSLAQDVPPYMTAAGIRAALHGLNLTGLRRRGFDDATITALKKAYRTIFRSGLTLKEASEKARAESGGTPEVAHLLDFIAASERGFCR